MIVLLQRSLEASVEMLDGPDAGAREAITRGLVALVGVERGDGDAQARWCADKTARLRIFPDEQGKMNRSLLDLARQAPQEGLGVLVVSQFTLAGDCRKGTRPSFTDAAPPHVAQPLVESYARRLEQEHGLFVARGRFGAMMRVSLVNDGPVTLVLQRTAAAPVEPT